MLLNTTGIWSGNGQGDALARSNVSYSLIMRLNRSGKLQRTDIWREGNYLDLWSVPHLLSGSAVGFSLYFFDFAFNAAFVIALLLLIGYEMFEVIVKIDETKWNRTLDVVVGMASFVPTFFVASYLSFWSAVYVFGLVLVVDAVLSFLGWHASQKAAVLEASLRAELERERQLFMKRRALIQKRWHNRRFRMRRHEPNAEVEVK